MKAVAKLKRRSGYVELAREGEWPSSLGCALRTQSALACANTQGVAPGMEVLMGAHRKACRLCGRGYYDLDPGRLRTTRRTRRALAESLRPLMCEFRNGRSRHDSRSWEFT
jgi:hypothetical protein